MTTQPDKEGMLDAISDIVQEELADLGTSSKLSDGTLLRDWANAAATSILAQLTMLMGDPHLHITRDIEQ